MKTLKLVLLLLVVSGSLSVNAQGTSMISELQLSSDCGIYLTVTDECSAYYPVPKYVYVTITCYSDTHCEEFECDQYRYYSYPVDNEYFGIDESQCYDWCNYDPVAIKISVVLLDANMNPIYCDTDTECLLFDNDGWYEVVVP